jgi:UDP-glucose 4-epimerase
MGKILVTGCAGYIGSVATDLFLKNGYTIVGVDNFQTGYRQVIEVLKNKYKNFSFYERDLKDNLDDIFQKEKDIKIVVHYAASCMVDESMKDPQKYFSNNVCGSLDLLNTMIKFNVKKIVFSSTCAVYGEAQYTPVDENHPKNPINPYGESKRMVEKIIEWYGKLLELNYFILRYFNVCGASDDGEIGDSKKPSVLLVQNAVRGALGIEKFYLTCPKVDTPDKTPIRDYINVVDLNEAHLLAVEKLLKEDNIFEIINLGTGSGNSVLEIVSKVEEITGKKIDRVFGKTRAGEYAKIYASIEKAKKVLGWQPKRKIEDSVKSLIAWYQKHPNGWEK